MLIILKNDRLRDKERKREIESLLGGIDDERFSLLVNLGKKITDWSNEELNRGLAKNGHMDTDEIDENVGVKVMIGDDEDEDEEDNDLYEINDEEKDEEEEDVEDKHQIISGKVKVLNENFMIILFILNFYLFTIHRQRMMTFFRTQTKQKL